MLDIFEMLFGDPDSIGLWMAAVVFMAGLLVMVTGALRGSQGATVPAGMATTGFGFALMIIFLIQAEPRQMAGQLVLLFIFSVILALAGVALMFSRSSSGSLRLPGRRRSGSDV